EIKDKAFEGSDYGKENTNSGSNRPKYFNVYLAFLVLIVLTFVTRRNSNLRLTKKRPQKFKKRFQGEYYRNYPYEENISDIYYLLYIMGASNFEKLLTSFILKWVKEERITVETERVGIIHKRDE